jgi:Holliday junction resolvase RusA-like endonuclease
MTQERMSAAEARARTARIDLPFPPSVHGLYRGGRWKGDISPEYKAWRDHSGLMLNRQSVRPFGGPVRIFARLVSPDDRKRDSDNYAKAILDLLVAHGVIAGDDKNIVRSHYVEWADEGPACTVIVQDAPDTWDEFGDVLARLFAAIPTRERAAS